MGKCRRLSSGPRPAAAGFTPSAGCATIVVFGIVGKSSGLVALLLAVGLADLADRPGIGRRALAIVTFGILGIVTVRAVVEGLEIDLTRNDPVIIVGALTASLFAVIPACQLLSLRHRTPTRLDAALCFYLAAEVVLVLIMCRASAGAWVNYGIQSVVLASVLTARALSRVCANAPSPLARWAIGLAALTLLVGVGTDAAANARLRDAERLGSTLITAHYGRPAIEFFYPDRPGINRLHGRLDLVYDDWLYPVFEAVHLAQPRSIWLRRAFTAGGINFVITKTGSPKIDGLGQTLSQLGYSRDTKFGTSYYAWRRVRIDSAPRRR